MDNTIGLDSERASRQVAKEGWFDFLVSCEGDIRNAYCKFGIRTTATIRPHDNKKHNE